MSARYRIGSRVARPINLSGFFPCKRGEVVEVYEGKKNGLGRHETFYRVKWEDGTIIGNYLEIGLEPEPLMVPTVVMVDRVRP